ncbi:MAG: peptidoglycan DD-metalloendopeptidase family protein [Archangium sp.]|nr:peptidoglycan DD-metalloendopeptidase family protein [Archangium sp.]
MTALALITAVVLLADATDVEDERADVQERLDAERTAFDALKAQRQSVLTWLDTLERLSRESTARAQALERDVARLTAQVTAAKREGDALQVALREHERRLAPQVVALYRLQRHDTVASVLSAADFAALVKRDRALKTLVRRDVEAFDDVAISARHHRRLLRRIERFEASARTQAKALAVEHAVARSRLTRFNELVASLQAEQNTKSRVIAELEANERELAAMVAELSTATTASGFRSKKGHMPMPTTGLVEVGYGKVINPRFNTVTVQKGIDVRAAAGTPVVAVAQGTVAFAGWLKGYGNVVIVDHGSGYHSLYAHLASAAVEVGNAVEEGEQLGDVGDTGSLKGNYLYFEIRKQGQAVDPQPWLSPEEGP